jgi:hypothetical protein
MTEAEKSQAEYDEKYERAKRLAKFWGRYTKPVNEDRAAAASELLIEIMEWNRDTKPKKKPKNPTMLSKVEQIMTIYHPLQDPEPNDMDATNEILDALTWWGSEGYQCSLEKVPDERKKNLKRMKDMVKYAETNDADAFKTTEDVGLEWKRNPEAAKELEAEIEYNITDILDWFKGGQISAKKKDHINALTSHMETWWDMLSDEDKEKEVDPSGKNYDCFIGHEVDELVEMYNTLNPLQLFWKDKGYDYAKRSGYLPPDEADAMDQKVKESWKWLCKKLNQKTGDNDDNDEDDDSDEDE